MILHFFRVRFLFAAPKFTYIYGDAHKRSLQGVNCLYEANLKKVLFSGFLLWKLLRIEEDIFIII